MRRLGLALVGALAAGTAAQAQTVIERQISNEPVETVITRNFDGSTTITRRPLGAGAVVTAPAPVLAAPAPVVTAPVFPNPFAALFAPPPTTVETVEVVEQPPVVTREVRPVVREVVRPRTVVRTAEPARASSVRVSERRLSPAVRDSYAMALTPAQREVVYRTIVRERPVVTREVIAPPMPIAPAVRTISTAPVVQRATIGSTLARDVMLYDMPQSVAVRVPAARQFNYVVVGDRVLLVDPETRLVIDDLSY